MQDELPGLDRAAPRGWKLLRGLGAAAHEAQSAAAAPAAVALRRVSVQGEASSTGDRPVYGLAAVLARRMSGEEILTEVLLDAGAGVDEVPSALLGLPPSSRAGIVPPAVLDNTFVRPDGSGEQASAAELLGGKMFGGSNDDE